MESEQLKLPRFPAGVQLRIDVVFPGEYRIGLTWKHYIYSPGIASYYPFDEAMDKCYQAFLRFQLHDDTQE